MFFIGALGAVRLGELAPVLQEQDLGQRGVVPDPGFTMHKTQRLESLDPSNFETECPYGGLDSVLHSWRVYIITRRQRQFPRQMEWKRIK